MARHSEFILTPITRILDEAGAAIGNLMQGVENYPLREYFLQSVFLKLTGAQEQKCKCIMWDVATYDYEFRYQNFGGRGELKGECSTLKDKNNIYKALLCLLNPNDDEAKVDGFCDDTKRNKFISDAFQHVELFYRCCSSQGYPKKEYDDFMSLYSTIKCTDIYQDKTILTGGEGKRRGTLAYYYTISVFRHRNRCAHNLLSYQGNKPNFNMLCDEFIYWNYYYRFSLVFLVDFVLTDVYKHWMDRVESGAYDD